MIERNGLAWFRPGIWKLRGVRVVEKKENGPYVKRKIAR
jgi:hypothetical protein